MAEAFFERNQPNEEEFTDDFSPENYLQNIKSEIGNLDEDATVSELRKEYTKKLNYLAEELERTLNKNKELNREKRELEVQKRQLEKVKMQISFGELFSLVFLSGSFFAMISGVLSSNPQITSIGGAATIGSIAHVLDQIRRR